MASIIMPTYNSEKYLCDSIQSAMAQSFDNWELIISDDGSEDKTLEIVKKFQSQDERIKLIRSPTNMGAANSRNAAVELAEGRYIAFLDSDDIWLPEKLSYQLDFMQLNDVAFSYARYQKINENGELITDSCYLPSKIDYHTLLGNQVIGCLTAVYDSEVFGKVYMPNIAKNEDFCLWLALLKRVKYAYCCDETIAQYRVRKGSVSSNKFLSLYYVWIVYRDIEKIPLLKSLTHLIKYIFFRMKRW